MVGEYHLGEFVNRFRAGSLVMRLPDSEAAAIPTQLFGTINGVIGLVASLPADQFAFLTKLQVSFRNFPLFFYYRAALGFQSLPSFTSSLHVPPAAPTFAIRARKRAAAAASACGICLHCSAGFGPILWGLLNACSCHHHSAAQTRCQSSCAV